MEGPPPLPADAETNRIESRDRLPVAEVSNEVIWSNRAFPRAPFVLREGESTKLGVFLSSSEDEARHVGVAEHHKRTGVLGQVIFEDADGNHYRDVDAKGIGYTEFESDDERPRVYRPEQSKEGVLGLMDRSIALKDASMAEEFLSKGIRTYRALGVTKLHEIVIPADRKNPDASAERIDIETARHRGIIPEGYEPAVEIRAFGTHRRVLDLEGTHILPIESQSYVVDAKNLVAQELGISAAQFSDNAYIQWFGKSLAESVARMHKAGYTDNYLTKHNITLDCRIVDLDSITPTAGVPDTLQFMHYFSLPEDTADEQYSEFVKSHQLFVKDFKQAQETFTELVKDIAINTGKNWALPKRDELQRLFRETYLSELKSLEENVKG